MFYPVWCLIPVSAGSNIKVTISIYVQNTAALTKRAKPITVIGGVVSRAVYFDRDENRLTGFQGKRSYYEQYSQNAAEIFHFIYLLYNTKLS
jgi:hypothetical protein